MLKAKLLLTTVEDELLTVHFIKGLACGSGSAAVPGKPHPIIICYEKKNYLRNTWTD